MTAQNRGWGPGWPNCQYNNIVDLECKGVSFPGGIHKSVHAIFEHLVHWIDENIEPIRDGWCWGFACRSIRGSDFPSNHSWGLAVDYNAPNHPLGKSGTWESGDYRKIRAKCDELKIRWGADYSGRKDEMHFEFMGTPEDAKKITERLAIQEIDMDENTFRRIIREEVTYLLRRELGNDDPDIPDRTYHGQSLAQRIRRVQSQGLKLIDNLVKDDRPED